MDFGFGSKATGTYVKRCFIENWKTMPLSQLQIVLRSVETTLLNLIKQFFSELKFSNQDGFLGYGFSVYLLHMSFGALISSKVTDKGCPPFQG